MGKPKKAVPAEPEPPEPEPQPVQAGAWRNRIVGHDVVDADQLLANPSNWRIHPQNQQDVIEGVLDEVGWVDEVKVNRNTNFVVDGHMRAAIAISRGEKVPITLLDLTPEEEKLVLASFNPVASMAIADEKMLNDLIQEIDTDNPAIATFLDGLFSEVNQSSPKGGAGGGSGEGGEAVGGEIKQHLVRLLMLVEDVAVIEQAIIRTGEATRGAAMLQICRSYLTNGGTKRQQH